MRRSQLKGVNLQNATLAGSDLHGAHLDHADVSGADLRGADLTGASLYGVDLDRAATTDGAQFDGATGMTCDRTAGNDTQAVEDHVAQAAEDIVLLTQDIAALASAASRSDDEDPSSVPERIADLQHRRDLLEERILSLIDDAAQAREASVLKGNTRACARIRSAYTSLDVPYRPSAATCAAASRVATASEAVDHLPSVRMIVPSLAHPQRHRGSISEAKTPTGVTTLRGSTVGPQADDWIAKRKDRPSYRTCVWWPSALSHRPVAPFVPHGVSAPHRVGA